MGWVAKTPAPSILERRFSIIQPAILQEVGRNARGARVFRRKNHRHLVRSAGTETARELPVADAADIDVDEVQVGIEAHAADLERPRGAVELLEFDARH